MAKRLKGYYRALHTKFKVTCPISDCSQPRLNLPDYVAHAELFHGIDARTKCCFCQGQYSWPPFQKSHHAVHLNECLKRFKSNHAYLPARTVIRAPTEASPAPEPIQRAEICPCVNWVASPRDMCGRSRDFEEKRIYESWFEEPSSWWSWEEWIDTFDKPYPPFTQESGLGDDIGDYVERFATLGTKDYTWKQIMIKANIFDQFWSNFDRIKGTFMILPFWCLCDGLRDTDGSPIHHRHMIVVYQNEGGQFKKYWRKYIKSGGIKAKESKFIKSQAHLVGVINYLCQPKKMSRDTSPEEGHTHSHYYINRPMYPHAPFALGTLFQNGLQAAVEYRLQKKNVYNRGNVIQKRDMHNNVRYAVPLRTTFLKECTHCPLPLKEDWEPIAVVKGPQAQPFLWLWENNTMTFRRNPDLLNMTKEERYRHHIARGNTFLEVIENEYYELDPGQTQAMHTVMQRTHDLTVTINESLEREKSLKQQLDTAKERENVLRERLDRLQMHFNEVEREKSSSSTHCMIEQKDMTALVKEILNEPTSTNSNI